MKKLLLISFCVSLFSPLYAHAQAHKAVSNVGYIDKCDSLIFEFGEQESFFVAKTEIQSTDPRRSQITEVNLAGDFNGWNSNNNSYQMKKISDHVYAITFSKKNLGKKGETKQFKFVLNHTYWVEPSAYALNKITGADGNTNLFVKL